MSLTGNLNTVSIPDLLQLIDSSKKTGMLSLKRQTQKKEIYFKEGNIIYATSSNTEEELLGNLLIRLGKLSQIELEEVLKAHSTTGKMIGAIIVEMGFLKKEQLEEYLKLQIEEIVYNLFSWKEGDFNFQEGKEPAEGQIITNLNTMNVIMEGTRKIDEIVEMQKILPKDNMILSINPNPKIKADSLNFDFEELKVLLTVDGDKTYADLIEQSPLGEYQTSRALLKLINRGIVIAGGKRQTRKDKKREETTVIEILHQVFSTSFSIIDNTLLQKLGRFQEKIWDKVLYQKKSAFPVLDLMMKNGTLLPSQELVLNSNKIPEEVRFHQITQCLQGLLMGYLFQAHNYLGKDITRKLSSEIKKSTAPFLLKDMEITKKYKIEDDLYRDLKMALKGEEIV